MIRKLLLPALLVSMLGGCATSYYYRDAGNGGGYYYGDPSVDYNYYGGYGYYGYGWYGWPYHQWPYYSSWYGPGYGFPYHHWGHPYPYDWPDYYDGRTRPRNPGPGVDVGLRERRPTTTDIRVRPGVDHVALPSGVGGVARPDTGPLVEPRPSQPRVMRSPEPRPSEPRVMRSPEPRSAPSLPPMQPRSAPRPRSSGMVRQVEQ